MLYHLLYPLHTTYPVFNVFRYISFRTVYAMVTAMVMALLFGSLLIRLLQRYQIGQQIRDEGPKSHLSKSGTPTMGGLLILMSLLVSTLLWADLTNRYIWWMVAATVGFGTIGFWDDFLKTIRKNSKGLQPRYKFSLQVLVAVFIAYGLYAASGRSSTLSLPFIREITPDLQVFYIPFSILVLVGAANAVNLTDGLDGLAIGPILTTAATYLIIVYIAGHRVFSEYLLLPYVKDVGEVTVLCGALIGAALGFLWFNAYPATVFMGDVGSLPLGGVLGAVALASRQPVLLVLVGGIFVVEALSVILQVASFKIRGKRIFRMSPIHHHFELSGWKEPQIVVRFWILSLLFSLIGLSTLKLR